MNMMRLEGPPPDTATYARSPVHGMRKQAEASLRALIEGENPSIVAIASYALINDLEPLIDEKGYSVSFVPLQGSAEFAEFYLKRG